MVGRSCSQCQSLSSILLQISPISLCSYMIRLISSRSHLNQKELNIMRSSTGSPVAVGLRILTADDTSHSTRDHQCYKLVVNSCGLKAVKPIFHIMNHVHKAGSRATLAPPPPPPLPNYYGSLKSCFLCTKNLRLDKDVYMYRGDQGFCSQACRDRQIYLDEIREIEKSTAQTLASFRCSRDSNRCRTADGLRQRQRRQSPIFTLS